ncbi:MAG: hypothetical protein LBU22_06075 [Dysgonamonadaceae bacterium]|nr:hypothetical protein [Dysgonamonadaceae bacterium]
MTFRLMGKKRERQRNGGLAAVSLPFPLPSKKDFAVMSTKRAKRTHGDTLLLIVKH